MCVRAFLVEIMNISTLWICADAVDNGTKWTPRAVKCGGKSKQIEQRSDHKVVSCDCYSLLPGRKDLNKHTRTHARVHNEYIHIHAPSLPAVSLNVCRVEKSRLRRSCLLLLSKCVHASKVRSLISFVNQRQPDVNVRIGSVRVNRTPPCLLSWPIDTCMYIISVRPWRVFNWKSYTLQHTFGTMCWWFRLVDSVGVDVFQVAPHYAADFLTRY